jgi:flagellar hook-basal body complex protein FliE
MQPISFPTVAPINPWTVPGAQGPVGTTSASDFQQLLQQSLQEARGLNAAAQDAIQGSLVGDEISMVETFTAMREADLALRLMVQVRNKLVDAFNELQQMRF